MAAGGTEGGVRPGVWGGGGIPGVVVGTPLGGRGGCLARGRGVKGGGGGEDGVRGAVCSIGQRRDGEVGAAVRSVIRRDEGREGAIGGDDVPVDGVGDLGGEAFLVFRGDAGGEFSCGDEEG